MIEKITKRDGTIADFNSEKIRIAAEKAFVADELFEGNPVSASQGVSNMIVSALERMFSGVSHPTVEQIQDLVEYTMVGLGYNSTQRKYSIYRQRHKELREMDPAKKAIYYF